MTAGGTTYDADAIGIELQFRRMSFEAADRGFAIIESCRVFGFLSQTIADHGGDETALGEPFHHRLIGVDLPLLPAAAVDIEDTGPGACGIRDVDGEFDIVLRTGPPRARSSG